MIGNQSSRRNADRAAALAIAVETAKRAVRQGVLWGLGFGATIAATEYAYKSSFPTAAARHHPEMAVDTARWHFEKIGGRVEPVMVLDCASASDPVMRSASL